MHKDMLGITVPVDFGQEIGFTGQYISTENKGGAHN